MTMPNYEEKLGAALSPRRLRHCYGVRDTAVQLARRYGADIGQAAVAGLLHDCARELPKNNLLNIVQSSGIVVTDLERDEPVLLHAPAGSVVAQRDYGVDDPAVCQAIRLHTTGGAVMTLLDKIIFLADYIEPGRTFPGVDNLRRLAQQDLDKAVLAAFDQTLRFLLQKGRLIHLATVEGRNGLVRQIGAAAPE